MGIPKWMTDAWDKYQQYKDIVDPVAKTVGSLGKAYIDYKSQKELNELSEEAYNQYMREKQAAGQEAQAAVDLNLTPMQISNIPQTKADVSSFTAVAARGGLMNLPTRQRKRYAIGTDEEDIEIMDPESVGDYELKMEEGVNIGEMAAFPDTGNPMSNAQQVWESGAIDQEIYQMDFKIFFQSGDWMDYIGKGEVQENMRVASAPGIEGLRHGGRARYDSGTDWIVKKSDVEEEEVLPRMGQQATPYASEPPMDALDAIGNVIIITNDGIVAISKEDHQKVMSGEITIEEALENAGHKSGIEKIELGNAKGGLPKRVRKDNGGIMNLGGLEKDYRTTGGFVPIGAYEKKDDVPARLSKNEFVFTADAVRAAGGGSINKGAQRMYDTMKHLEAQPQAKRMTV
jgi:hypothetical protein